LEVKDPALDGLPDLSTEEPKLTSPSSNDALLDALIDALLDVFDVLEASDSGGAAIPDADVNAAFVLDLFQWFLISLPNQEI
jgi:hypothetical protein